MIQASDDGFQITVLTPPNTPFAFVYLEGEIDQAAFQALSDAADWLAEATPVDVLVDLGGVTFAGAALANFLDRLNDTIPDEAAVMLCRSTPATRCVLDAFGMTQVAAMNEDMLPSSSTAGGRRWARYGTAQGRWDQRVMNSRHSSRW